MSNQSRRQTSGLRGNRLERGAIEELQNTKSWQNGKRLTWNALAARLKVSREAIAKKSSVVEAYHAAKRELKIANDYSPLRVSKRTLKDKVRELEIRILEKDRQLDAWIQRWVTVEYNCRLYNYDPDKLFAPYPALRLSVR